jgi:hypothetical protein
MGARKRSRGDGLRGGRIAYAHRRIRLRFPTANLVGRNSPRRHILWPCPEAIKECGVICVSVFSVRASANRHSGSLSASILNSGWPKQVNDQGLQKCKIVSRTTNPCFMFLYTLSVGTFRDSIP